MNLPGATAAIKAFIQATNNDTVDEKEVMRRTQICTSCPKLSNVSKFRSVISQQLGRIANRHRMPREIKQNACGACGCSLMLLIPSKVLHPDKPEELAARPSTCWVLTAEQSAEKKAEEDSSPSGCPNC